MPYRVKPLLRSGDHRVGTNFQGLRKSYAKNIVYIAEITTSMLSSVLNCCCGKVL